MPKSASVSRQDNFRSLVIVILGILLVALVIYVLFSLQPPITLYIFACWFVLVTILLWSGNRYISNFLDLKLPWKTYGASRFFIQLSLTIVYSFLVLNISYFIFKNIFTDDPPAWEQIVLMNILGGILILPVFSIYFGIHFLKAWKKSELENEQFQKESVRSQLEALKNHLDPHFLFNNLNILSSLIDKDQELSKQYLEKFAEVYRIILQHEVTELITLHKEIEFINSYLYLIKIRFQKNIQISLSIDQKLKNKLIPPLSIQMLIENCFKHNAITDTRPLNIDIYNENDQYIIVENNINQKKTVLNGKSSGLQNIENRYSYFTNMPLVIEKNDHNFKVKLPLLEINAT